MDTVYEAAVELLLNQPHVTQWPLLERVVRGAQGERPVAWDFPIAGCLVVGGDQQLAVPPVAAITCAHIAIILLDDILDEDPRGEYHELGAGRAANLATGLNSLGHHILNQYACAHPERASAVYNGMLGGTAYGQDLDVQNTHTEDGYWAVARAKSSPYFSAGLTLGALYGGASVELATQLERFGAVFGEIMQIHDDLNDCLAEPANVDWLQGRAPLPLLFAELAPHPEQQRFMALRGQVSEAEALREAQEILVRSGAISYCINELLSRQQALLALLAQMPLANPQPLQQILEHAIAPVEHLFAAVGKPQAL